MKLFFGILMVFFFSGPIWAGEWGIKMQVEQTFYHVGDKARVNVTYYNLTERPKVGICNVGGGLGCCYDIVIEDEYQNIVTRPRAICMMVFTTLTLKPHSVLNLYHEIPLVRGTYEPERPSNDNLPLPPGFYRVCFRDKHRFPFSLITEDDIEAKGLFSGGTAFESCVPIKIIK